MLSVDVFDVLPRNILTSTQVSQATCMYARVHPSTHTYLLCTTQHARRARTASLFIHTRDHTAWIPKTHASTFRTFYALHHSSGTAAPMLYWGACCRHVHHSYARGHNLDTHTMVINAASTICCSTHVLYAHNM